MHSPISRIVLILAIILGEGFAQLTFDCEIDEENPSACEDCCGTNFDSCIDEDQYTFDECEGAFWACEDKCGAKHVKIHKRSTSEKIIFECEIDDQNPAACEDCCETELDTCMDNDQYTLDECEEAFWACEDKCGAKHIQTHKQPPSNKILFDCEIDEQNTAACEDCCGTEYDTCIDNDQYTFDECENAFWACEDKCGA